MPEEIIMNCESNTTENLEDGNLESSTLAKIGSDDVKDHVFQEIEMSSKTEERSERVATETFGSKIIESSVEVSHITEEHLSQETKFEQSFSEHLEDDKNIDTLVKLQTGGVTNEESELEQEVTKSVHKTEILKSEEITHTEESHETGIINHNKWRFGSSYSIGGGNKMTKAVSKQSISRQTMQEMFNETILEPYKASYSPLLTIKRNQKNPFEEKTPELILIEQLLDVHDDPKIEEEHLETKEDNEVESQTPICSKFEPNNNPPQSISNKSSEIAKPDPTSPENDTNFVSFRKSCCIIS